MRILRPASKQLSLAERPSRRAAAGSERGMLTDMVAGLDPQELIELALLLIAVGALSGFLAGVFGIGGGAILVPVFYECFRLAGVPLEVRMPLCIGTSLAIIIPTSLSSFRAHYNRGAVDLDILRRWWLPVVLGVTAGSVTARFAPERLFKIVFVIVAWSAAARLLLARDTWKLGDDVPKGFLMRVYGFFVGLLSTLMGVGGGLFANLLMTFYGRPIHQAVATSSAIAVLISIPGAIGYVYAGWPAAARFPDVTALQAPFALGYVSLIGAVLVMPTTLITAPLGVRAAHAMSKRALEMAFGTYMFIVGGRFAISLLNGQ
ncbi:putative membrane protein YfcA [Bradyrhizobium algeriense]|uniref:Probable membrane transporter protein n=2 Tax=Bradyrhizobium algeriense TaxID=634784 RepID=A0ABU8BM74_9BRAD